MTLTERLGERAAITRGIVNTFRTLNAFPHPSHHEEAIGDWLIEELRGRGLHPVRDGAGNVMADVPATPGRENAPRIMLQGHLDMVCAVAEGSGFDPIQDTVTVREVDGILCSDGRSSLGADNNLGTATALWLLGQDIHHGPVRLLFTVAEEIGLEGAKQVDPAWLDGCTYLLNTDGFHLGRAVVGSAGGRRETYDRALETVEKTAPQAWRLSITGGRGGHSGDDIHRGRGNALQLMGQLLDSLRCPVADFYGGTAHNAIAGEAHAVVCCEPPRLEGFAAQLEEEFRALDPALCLTSTQVEVPARVWAEPLRQGVLALVGTLFHGVYALHHAFPEVVGASANVGRVWTEEGRVKVGAFVRSAQEAEGTRLAALHDGAAERYGFGAEITAYPGWPGDGDNRLVETMDRVYRRVTGRWMEITAVHVGLEPSVFQHKCPGLMLASTGPEILDAHSVHERAPLEGLPDFALLLAGVLEEL